MSVQINNLPAPVFRRRVVITAEAHGTALWVRAALEDDFHHFRVEVRCVDGVVTQATGEAPRHPYTLCKLATAELTQLVGMPLTGVPHAVTRYAEASEQCTHLLDLAGLCVAAAARGTAQRQYDIEVPQREPQGRTQPKLWRDGVLLLEWLIDDDLITGPAPYTGINLRAGLARWALTTLPEEEAEAALLLRRCTAIAVGRSRNLDLQVHARATGYCFAQQPLRAEQAIRVLRSTLDFSATPALLCADDQDWLRPNSASDN